MSKTNKLTYVFDADAEVVIVTLNDKAGSTAEFFKLMPRMYKNQAKTFIGGSTMRRYNGVTVGDGAAEMLGVTEQEADEVVANALRAYALMTSMLAYRRKGEDDGRQVNLSWKKTFMLRIPKRDWTMALLSPLRNFIESSHYTTIGKILEAGQTVQAAECSNMVQLAQLGFHLNMSKTFGTSYLEEWMPDLYAEVNAQFDHLQGFYVQVIGPEIQRITDLKRERIYKRYDEIAELLGFDWQNYGR